MTPWDRLALWVMVVTSVHGVSIEVEEEPENMCFGAVWSNERLTKLVHHFLNLIRIG